MQELLGPNLNIPAAYIKAPMQQRLELLAGLIDTDGSLTSGTFEFMQKRKLFADIAVYTARSLGFRATLKPKTVPSYPDNTYWRVHISGDIERIPTRIPHKQAASRKQTKDWTRTGFKVEPLGEGDYFGFTVNKDGRFLLGDFTVTHNTTVGMEVAKAMTNIVRQKNSLADEAIFLALDLSSMLPEDLGGIPKVAQEGDLMVTSFAVQKKLAPFCQPGAYGVLVLDDITQAAPAVQVAARQTVLFRTIGDYKLADGVMLLITGNRREDKSNASTLPAHFRNSCCILSVEPDLEEWCEWYGRQPRTNPVIAAYLRWRPTNLAQVPSEADKAGAFATPRSWAKLGRMMAVADSTSTSLEVMRGLVGEGIATELRGFMNTRPQLVNPGKVLDNPEKAMPNPGILDSPDKAYAMITGLGELAANRRTQAEKDGKAQDIQNAGLQLMRALAWASKGDGRRSNREYISVGVSTYTSNGGEITDLIQAARLQRDDPLVKETLNFLANAVKNAPKG